MIARRFIHSFKGFFAFPSSCRVKIFSDDGENFILFEDIDDGTSVTNASEQLASEIVQREGFNPTDCRFFETYSQYGYETIDEIEYTWHKGRNTWDDIDSEEKWIAKSPQWKPSEPEIREMFEL